MNTKTILTVITLGSVCLAAQVWADVLEMKNKKVLQGQYQGGTADSVRFKVGEQTQVVPVSDIVALTFTGGSTNGAAGATGTGAAAATGAAAGGATAATASGPVTIPAGTSVLVIMDTGVDSSRDTAGARFAGKTAEDVIVNGKTAIPKGSPVNGRLNQAQEAGRLAGQSMLELALTDVTVNGQRVPVMTESVSLAGAKEGKKTARRAGAGAVIGGIADGGGGAAKGAAIGGATALGKGQSVNVPAGSTVEFRITQPVSIQ